MDERYRRDYGRENYGERWRDREESGRGYEPAGRDYRNQGGEDDPRDDRWRAQQRFRELNRDRSDWNQPSRYDERWSRERADVSGRDWERGVAEDDWRRRQYRSGWNRDETENRGSDWNMRHDWNVQRGRPEWTESRDRTHTNYPRADVRQDQRDRPNRGNWDEGNRVGWWPGEERWGTMHDEPTGRLPWNSADWERLHTRDREAWDRAEEERRRNRYPYGRPGEQTSGYFGKGPKGYRRSDERIREDVSEQLEDHPEIDATNIEVLVKDGEVTLTGTVDHRRAKRLSEDIAESCRGVKDVHNQIRVASGELDVQRGTTRDRKNVA